MTQVYINYPEPHITSYVDSNSAQIGKHNKVGQRNIRVDISTLSEVLSRFDNKQYRFASNPGFNDMWLEIDFDNSQFESQVLETV